ncbi:MAG: hypothetical protein GF317_01775 [Candidatus Lokiarchaeota archaeon]|nr:hypothetical protein [Candidatus Lokiarchaeota archaeon]MBD3198670.1 hypothetical protein [Candidatus Lokiarchaeota archaeon]
MKEDRISHLIKSIVGKGVYKKGQEFPNNKINIISFHKKPIHIRAVIFDEDREFHLIIDSEKMEIFHDCPSFLIYSELNQKICEHFIKILLYIDEEISINLLNNIENYHLTSEDFGSSKKSENFRLIADKNFNLDRNYIEGLNYLQKALIDNLKSDEIIANYLRISIEKNLFIEFFEFILDVYEKELGRYLEKYMDLIQNGFQRFMNNISKYSFFNLLRIINSVEKIFTHEETNFLSLLLSDFSELLHSTDFNERYFSLFFLSKYKNDLIKINSRYQGLFNENFIEELKKELLEYFIKEIDNFCVLEKLNLMKEQFETIGISPERYLPDYKKYKREFKELEKKVYLKKFAYLLFLMKKYNLKKSKIDFKKKRNTYIVNHDRENLKNPVYHYIIRKIGFYGMKDSTIKSSEIGINYFIMRELFLDDFTKFPDIFYYKKQFWGEEDHKVEIRDSISLLTKSMDYSYEINKNYSIDKVQIIEWDLASKPIKGSIVNAYGSQLIIPDQNNSLFHDLKPFDLCFCLKTPVRIETNIIKTVNTITKSSFKDVIRKISEGMDYIEGYYPLSLVESVKNKELDPFEASDLAANNANRQFIPHYDKFVDEFNKFLFNFINQEKSYVFNQIKKNPKGKIDALLILLNLSYDLRGLNLPYYEIIKPLLNENIKLKEFKEIFPNLINNFIQELLDHNEVGSTYVFNLKKMKHTSFSKYIPRILKIRKTEFESSFIKKKGNSYDISEVLETFYGKRIIKIIGLDKKQVITSKEFKTFSEFAHKLKLKIHVINQEN